MSNLSDFISSGGAAGAFGDSTFVGSGSERTIAHGLGATPTFVSVTATTNPSG